ncbi:MATE family efflux transporter [Verticiella sediminum]|nr:MATE family efflux transporter [Verticiella sediminum]
MPLFLAISRLALPNLVAFAAQLLMATVDGMVAARLGATALAGVALVLPLQMLIGQTSNGAFGAAVGGMIARSTGARDAAAMRSVAWHAVLTAGVIGVLFCVGGVAFAPRALAAMGGSGDVLAEAVRYATPIFLGCVGVWLTGALAGIARGQGRMWLPAGALICAAAMHALLAPRLAAHWGVAGIGASWAASYTLSLLPLVVAVHRTRALAGLREFRWQSPVARSILRIGVPSIGAVLLANLSVVLATSYATRYGQDVLIGFGIGARFEYVLVPFAFSIGMSLVALAGQARGAGDHLAARRYAMAGVLGSGLLLGVIGSAAALFPALWLRWFDIAPAAHDAAALYLRHVGPFYLFFGFGLTAFFASQAFGRIGPALGGAGLRVLGVAAGSAIAAALTPEPRAFFIAIACAFMLYGLANLYAIHLVSRPPARVAPQPGADDGLATGACSR